MTRESIPSSFRATRLGAGWLLLVILLALLAWSALRSATVTPTSASVAPIATAKLGSAAAGNLTPGVALAAAQGGQAAERHWPHPGIYGFFDWRHLDPEDYPFLVGGHEVFGWNRIEGYRQGVYDWSKVEEWLEAEAALGKPTVLGFNSYDGQCCGGEWLPDWFKQSHPDGFVTCQDGTVLPRYWSSAYLQAWQRFIEAAAARYDQDPRVAWIEISHGIYGETAPAENEYDACLSQHGLTSQLWVDTVNRITDMYVSAFRNKPLTIQYAPFFLDRLERRQFTDYAGALGVGMKHNKLLVDHDDQVIDDPDYFYYRAGQYDPMFTFAGQVPMAWEVYRDYFPTETETYWAFLNALNKHATYFLVTYSLLSTATPLEAEVMHLANKYAGRTLADTPSVWVALRETEHSWYPQRGNFDFWLYQHDDVPGSKTVPLWRVTAAAQGRYARRTDGANGNPYMAFGVDDGYILGGRNTVSVTVTYLDAGTDTWQLQYDAVDDPYAIGLTVRKENTGQWRQASVVLSDAHFGNRQEGGPNHPGMDFRLWDAEDGNDTFHLVDVARIGGGEALTVTLQPDGSDYAGMVDTYLSSWDPNSNFADYWRVSVRSQDTWAGLLRFELGGALPASARVQAAALDLYVGSRSVSTPMDIALYVVQRSWRESEATWSHAQASVAWSEPGANGVGTDHTGPVLDSKRLQREQVWERFDVTQAVSAWHSGVQLNHGLLLRGGSASGSVSYDFVGSEYWNTTLRPRLVITYSVAPPTPTVTPTPSPGPATPTPTTTPARTSTPTPTPDRPARAVIASRVAQPPVIDGNLGDWWLDGGTLLNVETADFVHPRSSPDPADPNARFWAAWDADNLYLAAWVWDGEKVADSEDIWEDDGLEFAIDGAGDSSFVGVDDHQITIALDGRVKDWGITELPLVARAVRITSGGYVLEMALPREVLQPPVWEAGHSPRFTVGLHDDDDGGTWEAYLVWEGSSTTDAVDQFGSLVLSDSVWPTPTPVPSPSFTATPTATADGSLTPTPGATSTPTPTGEVSATPTATATSLVPGTGAVQGVVFSDGNGDGLFGPEDRPLAGAQVNIYREEVLQAGVMTGTDGRFEFASLSPAAYVVREIDPPGYVSSLNELAVEVVVGEVATLAFIDYPMRSPSGATYLPLLLHRGV